MSGAGRALWHGGVPGLKPGDPLLPPSEQGLKRSAHHAQSLAARVGPVTQRADRVYVTTNRDVAWAYASMWREHPGAPMGGGTLYVVEATLLELDPDFLSLPGEFFQTPRATVKIVAGQRIKHDPRKCQRILSEILRRHQAAKRG